jgi:cytochrome b561
MSQACSQSMKRAGLALLGIPLMVIGLIGWVVPIIPGAPLFFFGLALTISWHPKGRALVERWQQGLKDLATRWGLRRKSPQQLQAELFRNEPSAPNPNLRDNP